jgi:hypothetical protein
MKISWIRPLFLFAAASIVLGYAARGAFPGMWVPFAWIDLAFLVAFATALQALRPRRA